MATNYDDKLFDDSTPYKEVPKYDESLFEDTPTSEEWKSRASDIPTLPEVKAAVLGGAESLLGGFTPEALAVGKTAATGLAGGAEDLIENVSGYRPNLGGDKIEGYEDLLSNFKKYSKEMNAPFREAEKESPNAYLAGSLVGGTLPAVFTGGASAVANLGKTALSQGAKQIAKNVGKTALIGGAQGALSGYGYSDASIVDALSGDKKAQDTLQSDVLTGGVTGAVLGAGLPLAIKGVSETAKLAGKGLEKVGKFAANEYESIQDLVDTYNFVKQGKQIVGTDAKKGIYKNIEGVSKDIVKGTTKQITQSSEEMGNILKTVKASDDIRQIVPYLKSNIENKNLLADDRAKLLNLVEQLEVKSLKETVESGEDIAKKNLANRIDQETSAGEMLGQKIKFGEPVKTPQGSAFNTLKTTTDETGNQIANVIPTPIPEDKITKEMVTNVKNADLQDIYDLKKMFRDTDQLNPTGNTAKKEYMNFLDEAIEENLGTDKNIAFNESKKKMKDAFQARNVLPALDESGKLGQDTNLRVEKLLRNETDNKTLDLETAFKYLDDKFVSPELKQSAFDLSKQSRLNKEAGETGIQGFTSLKGGLLRTGSGVANMSNRASYVAKSGKEIARKILSLPDNTLTNIAGKMNVLGGEALATSLENAIKNPAKRDRLLWSISQQPAFKELFNKIEEDEINSMDNTLGQ